MKGLESGNVDISFILQHKFITPRKLRPFKDKTKVIHGCDIKLLSLAYVFLRNNHSYPRNVQRKLVIPSQRTKFERKRAGEQQRTGLRT